MYPYSRVFESEEAAWECSPASLSRASSQHLTLCRSSKPLYKLGFNYCTVDLYAQTLGVPHVVVLLYISLSAARCWLPGASSCLLLGPFMMILPVPFHEHLCFMPDRECFVQAAGYPDYLLATLLSRAVYARLAPHGHSVPGFGLDLLLSAFPRFRPLRTRWSALDASDRRSDSMCARLLHR